jgi:Xaa-Pro aminopeptidase
LITSQFIHYLHDVEDALDNHALDIFLYTAPDGLEGDAMQPLFLDLPPGGRTDPLDDYSRSATLRALDQQPAFPDAATALRSAAAPYSGAIFGDTPVVARHLGSACLSLAAEPLLRRIRMIKSPREIDLMRHAASSNAEAARAAVFSITPGNSYEELRRAFFAETGKRGGVPLFLSTDSMAMRQRDGVIRQGRSFQIDAVSSYAGYHGDYGRTVFVGDPDPLVEQMVEAASCANAAIAAELRPGLRYSDVRAIGQQAARAAGHRFEIACSPHSVGLFHTDEAFEHDAIQFQKADHVIRENMVLSVDCPVLHLDAGGNVHLEDLWLITSNGCEPLNSLDAPFLQI